MIYRVEQWSLYPPLRPASPENFKFVPSIRNYGPGLLLGIINIFNFKFEMNVENIIKELECTIW